MSFHARTVRLEAPERLDRRYRGLRLPCSPTRRAELRESLERHGQQQPLLASSGIEEGRLVLLDGFTRVELLETAGASEVLVAVAPLDAPQGLAALLAANASRRGLSDLEEAWVVDALRRDHGLEQVAIGELLGHHKSWVSRRLSLVTRLERQVQDDVRLGLIGSSVARELARLPRGNQAAVSQAVVRHGLSSRQVIRLVGVLLAVDPARRAEVLADPLGHLPEGNSRQVEPRPDPRLSEAANGVRRQLLRLGAAANRLEELFHSHPPTSFSGREVALLGELARPILAGTRRALARVESLSGVAQETARAS